MDGACGAHVGKRDAYNILIGKKPLWRMGEYILEK
jgi:hypothetical protein